MINTIKEEGICQKKGQPQPLSPFTFVTVKWTTPWFHCHVIQKNRIHSKHNV